MIDFVIFLKITLYFFENLKLQFCLINKKFYLLDLFLIVEKINLKHFVKVYFHFFVEFKMINLN